MPTAWCLSLAFVTLSCGLVVGCGAGITRTLETGLDAGSSGDVPMVRGRSDGDLEEGRTSDSDLDVAGADVPADVFVDVGAAKGDATDETSAVDAATDAVDAVIDIQDGTTSDGTPQRCSTSDPFGPVTPVPGLENTTGNSISVSLSPDELTAYTSMFRFGQADVFTATRVRVSDPFGVRTPVDALNSSAEESWPSVTADGLTIYLTSTRNAAYQLFVAHRATLHDTFSTPVELSALDQTAEGAPYVIPDGSALYFHSFRFGSGDLFRAAKRGSSFEPPELLASISANASENIPVVSPDELTIYYFTDLDAQGRDGIWMATRSSTSGDFTNAVFFPELNGASPSLPSWISPDGCRLYLQQVNRVSGTTSLWFADRRP